MCDCGDSLCQGSLGFHRGRDPGLYDFYSRNLPRRGWGGSLLTDDERGFLASQRSPVQRERMASRMAKLRSARRDGSSIPSARPKPLCGSLPLLIPIVQGIP